MEEDENLPSQCHPPRAKLRNIGPTSQKWLESVGIFTISDLEKTGAQKAYEMIKQAGYNPSKNLLYALIGAIQDEDWKIIADALKHKTT